MILGKEVKYKSPQFCIKIIAVLCFICLSVKVSGQGCYIASLNLIYTDRVPLTNIFLFSTAVGTTCPAGSTSATPVYILTGTGSTACTVLVSVGGTLIGTGVIRNYTPSYCPLDDYLPLLVLPIALITIIRLRRSKRYPAVLDKNDVDSCDLNSPILNTTRCDKVDLDEAHLSKINSQIIDNEIYVEY